MAKLFLIFHGPWGFAVDGTSGYITAATPVCGGHTYVMGRKPYFQPLNPGQYGFVDEKAIVADPGKQNTKGAVQAQFSAPPSGFVLPNAVTTPGTVHCALVLPKANFWGCWPAWRHDIGASGDNLMCGSNFQHLATSPKGLYLAIVQVLCYDIKDATQIGLMNNLGYTWTPPLADIEAANDIKLHLIAKTMGTPDVAAGHFAMMTAMFGLDLKLGGPDILTPVPNPGGKIYAPPPPGVDEATDIEDEQLPGNWAKNVLGIKRPRNVRINLYPIICGSNVVIHYTAK